MKRRIVGGSGKAAAAAAVPEPGVVLEGGSPWASSAQVVAVTYHQGEKVEDTLFDLAAPSLKAALRVAREQGLLRGDAYAPTAILAPEGVSAARLILLGAGPAAEIDAERVRRLAGAALRLVSGDEVERLALYLRAPALDAPTIAQAATEGCHLGWFEPGMHRTNGRKPRLREVALVGLGRPGARLQKAVEHGRVFAAGTNFARRLAVEPANHMTPQILAENARELGRLPGVRAEVLDEKAIKAKGMGGILAVGQGSANPPRLIVLRYEPQRRSRVRLGLVGKGVCFDTGGISIKPAQGMHFMKADMAGAAAVLGAFRILAELRAPISVLAVVPAVENMPGGRAWKPGDVFKSYAGKTVEVLNTDAEGRLILCDGMAYALEQEVTHLIDVATLTGAIRRALGDLHVGTFTDDEAFLGRLQSAAAHTGESFWRMPMDDDYGKDLKKSLVADLNESGGLVGASVAAVFLKQFAGDVPWIHLDIAGTNWREDKVAWGAKGPCGVASRTLAELALEWKR